MTTALKSEIETLSDAALDNVTGGLNPQPLPPGPPPPDLFRFMPRINFGFAHFTLPAAI